MDFAINIDPDTGIGDMTFEKARDIFNNVYLSLSIERGTFFQNPKFGLRRRFGLKNNEQTAALIRRDHQEALQWLVNTGRANKVEVFTEIDRLVNINRLKVLVEVTQGDGQKVTFERFVEVI